MAPADQLLTAWAAGKFDSERIAKAVKSVGVEGKVALHESYFRWAPAISARGAVGRLFGSSDLDLMTIEVDGRTKTGTDDVGAERIDGAWRITCRKPR